MPYPIELLMPIGLPIAITGIPSILLLEEPREG